MKAVLKAIKKCPYLETVNGRVFLVEKHKNTIDLAYYDNETGQIQLIYDKMIYVSTRGNYIRMPIGGSYVRLYLEDAQYGRKTIH